MFSEYVLILVWVGLAGLFLSNTSLKRRALVCGEEVEQFPWLVCMIVILPLIIMAGTRDYIGDTFNYVRNFNNMEGTISGISEYADTLVKDKAFYIFAYLIKIVIGNRPTLYLLILAFIQCTIVMSIFRKYSSNSMLSIFLFLISTDYISWLFNGVRQFTAVVIIFAATSLMIRKKYLFAIIVIIFASLFHQSALLMIPFIFIAQGKVWNKRTVLFIGLAIIAVLFIDQFTNILDDSLANTQYRTVVSDYTEWEDDGTNPLRVAVYSVPALLAFFGRKKIQKENNKIMNFCINMSIISMGLYIVSMFTSGIFIGRLPIYCSLYGYISLPWQIQLQFNDNNKRIIYFLMIAFYAIFYYFQMHVQYGLF